MAEDFEMSVATFDSRFMNIHESSQVADHCKVLFDCWLMERSGGRHGGTREEHVKPDGEIIGKLCMKKME